MNKIMAISARPGGPLHRQQGPADLLAKEFGPDPHYSQ
jgi:hypothetical protein